MWKLVTTGGALLIAGAAKFADHLNRVPTLEDYLAFRCGGTGSVAEPGTWGHALLSVGHCWGCFAMALGAGLLAVSAWKAFLPEDGGPRRAD